MGSHPRCKTCDSSIQFVPSQVRLSQPAFVSSLDKIPEVPPKALSFGARELLRWMIWRGGRARQLWWSQSRMAADVRLGVRTVQRHIAELVRLGAIEVIRRGRTSCLYNLSITCANLLNAGVSDGGSNGPYLLNSSETKSTARPEPLPEKKPPTKARTLEPAEPDYLETFARSVKGPSTDTAVMRWAAASAFVGLPADLGGEFARKVVLQPRLLSPGSHVRNPAAYRIAAVEKELLKVKVRGAA